MTDELQQPADCTASGHACFQGGAVVGVSFRFWTGAAWGAEHTLTAAQAEASISGDQLFGELVIDLTAAGIFPAGACDVFSTAMAKSRASSSSFNNELKDFIAPIPINVSNCRDITIHKQDDVGASLAGAGFTLFADAAGAPGAAVVPVQTCTTNASGNRTLSNVHFGTYWVVETTVPAGTALRRRSR